jgi:hypothetical protein
MAENGGAVEVDETYIGRVKGVKMKRGGSRHKNAVLSLLDRETGQVRSFHVANANAAEITPIVRGNISTEARLMTDQAPVYKKVGADFARHDTVDHSKDEYARRDGGTTITTNTIESYFSAFKRGMRGTYQHCAEKHLHRYLADFDFRYNNRVALGVGDTSRANELAKGIVGKRLTYRRPNPKDIPF